jgi:hypothetical protein
VRWTRKGLLAANAERVRTSVSRSIPLNDGELTGGRGTNEKACDLWTVDGEVGQHERQGVTARFRASSSSGRAKRSR